LISGTIIVNESILTGESTPVFKTNIPNSSLSFNIKNDSKHILYAGTKILQKKNYLNRLCLGIAIATGFNTQKGNLIRTILYPPVRSFQFKKDSMKYILFMGFISIFGFLITLNSMVKANYSLSAVIQRGLEFITITVPPCLPACLGIGIAFAVNRLKTYGIKCINRDGINIAGQVDLVCFDKTGTLTEDFLDISGFVPINYETGKFVLGDHLTSCNNLVKESYLFYKEIVQNCNYYQDIKNLNLEERIKMLRLFYIECMASCHSITKINNQFLGDPIDLKMFEATDWIIKESSDNDFHVTDNNNPLIFNFIRYKEEKELDQLLNNNAEISIEDEEKLIRSQYELGVVRKFEFSSNLQRMSVVVKNKNEDYFKIYTKGSPEKVKDLCREDTFPKNFDTMLSKFTNKGYRVLGLSIKLMKMDYIQSQKLKREKAESNMIFLGFLIFENKLKDKTTSSIDILRNAGLKLIMATGDNVLTAVSVSKECNMVDKKSEILSMDILKKDGNETILIVNLINEHSRISLIEKSNIEKDDLLEDSINYYTDDENNLNNNDDFLNKCNFEREKDLFIRDIDIEKNKSTRFLIRRNTLLTRSLNPEIIGSDSEDGSEADDFYDTRSIDKKILNKVKKEFQYTDKDTIKFEGNFDHIQLNNTELMNSLTIAVTGKAFEFFHKYNKLYLETNKEDYLFFENIFRVILNQTIVYARMSPENKALLIECLKKDNVIVAMIGDGANDIGALKSADIGISLSLEDASIASNFLSNVPDISCLIKLFQEGKASFVTSIQCFKYMILYSMIQFISVTLLMIVGNYFSDNQFLSIDLFLIFPLVILISRTGSSNFLSKEKPNGNLFSYEIILSISFQVLIVFLFQYAAFFILRSQSWYVETEPSDSPLFTDTTYENTVS